MLAEKNLRQILALGWGSFANSFRGATVIRRSVSRSSAWALSSSSGAVSARRRARASHQHWDYSVSSASVG
jgi:hypothetical protein